MFTHVHGLQFEAKPDAPDPAFARRFQEVLGGKWGEMTVAMQYLFQGGTAGSPASTRTCCSTSGRRSSLTSR